MVERKVTDCAKSQEEAIAKALALSKDFLKSTTETEPLLEPGIEKDPNWYRVRQAPPGNYDQFRLGWLSQPDGIRAIYARRRDNRKWDIQALLFSVDKWDEPKIRKWCKDHDFKV